MGLTSGRSSDLAAYASEGWKPSPAAPSALQRERPSGGRPQGSGMRRRRRRRSRSPRIGSRMDARAAVPERGPGLLDFARMPEPQRLTVVLPPYNEAENLP